MGQLGFFDADNRLKALSAKGDPLEAIDLLVPWESFRGDIEAAVLTPETERKSAAGRKPIDAIVLFRMLILQSLYNLSDEQVEYQVRDHAAKTLLFEVPICHSDNVNLAPLRKLSQCPTMQGIYLRLFRYRERPSRSPLEDYLTEALADLLSRCPLDVGKAFITDVLVGANAKSSWLNLSNTLRDLVWRTQVTIPDGRLDLVIESNGKCLFVVENKVLSGIRLYKAELDEDEIDDEIEGENSNTNGSARGHHDGELAETEASEESEIELRNQLECYGTWLAKQARPSGWKGGLTLLTHFTTPPVDFSDANASGYGPVWRFSATWSKVYQWLIEQKPNLSKVQQGNGESAWRVLALEFADFLKEKDMSEEQLTSSDVAAMQIFVGSADRLWNTL